MASRRAQHPGRVLFALCTIVPVLMLGQGLLSPVLPAYCQSFGVGAATVGLLVTSFGVGRLLADVPAGYWAQRIGRRPLLVAGPAIVFAGSMLCYAVRSFAPLVVFRFVMGAGSAIYTTAAMTVLVDLTEPVQRGRVMSIYQSTFLLGSGIGPTVGGLVSSRFGYRAPFLLCALFAAAAAVWAFMWVPETRLYSDALDHEGGGRHKVRRMHRLDMLTGIRSLAGNTDFLLIATITFSIFFTRTGSRMTIVPLLGYNELGLTEVQVGFVLSTVAALNFVTLYPAGALADRIGRKAVIVPSTLVAAIALACFALARSFGGFMVGALLLGIGTGLAGGTPAAYVSDISPTVSSGIAMGMYRMVGDVGFVLGPVVLGAIADAAGYRASLVVNLTMLTLSSVLFAFCARETLDRSPTPGSNA